ncbi:MAG: tetratricopeptide repeat protein [Candidatus Omnitrophota bacterium]|nr:tetratricopeptide repeat protein [Candidatus Omnitrophota bacterium]MBU2528241.1 tetratricopeptide repeat protein [bacterium]MBU3929619.1 tetratricopeptide repeat protein [bacterium]MBU4122200.1 tetratricopeptide repeat protein [bacterium]
MKIIKFKKGFAMTLAAIMFFPLSLRAQDVRELMREKKWTAARARAEELLKENPSDAGLLISAGICAVNQRNYAAAIEHLSRASEISPEKFLPAYLLGVIYEETGNLYKARAYFEKALKNAKEKKNKDRAEKHLDNVSEAIGEGR